MSDFVSIIEVQSFCGPLKILVYVLLVDHVCRCFWWVYPPRKACYTEGSSMMPLRFNTSSEMSSKFGHVPCLGSQHAPHYRVFCCWENATYWPRHLCHVTFARQLGHFRAPRKIWYSEAVADSDADWLGFFGNYLVITIVIFWWS